MALLCTKINKRAVRAAKRLVSAAWTAAFIVLFAFFAQNLAAQQDDSAWYIGKPIKNIVFEGLHNIRSADLEGVTEPFIGRILTDELFFEIQGSLYALEYFEDISPVAVPADDKRSAVILRFKVTERPVVAKVTFSGNKGVRLSELRDTINTKTGDIFNLTKLRIDEQAVLVKYKEKGFPNVTIKTETKENPNKTVDVTFIVNEGEQITVQTISFEGNKEFSERTLRRQLTLKAKSLLNDGAFQEASLINDKAAVEQYYHDRGYIDAQVSDIARSYTEDAKGVHLTLVFKIYEGTTYTFEGITFEGNHIFSDKTLEELVRSKKGDIVNAQKLEADLQRVADLYYENGYIYNAIEREEQRDMDNRTIRFLIKITEHDRAFVENIIIRGNEKTRSYVLLREIPLESGDIFSKGRVMDGLRNLYNLQYFSSVIPETPPGSAEGLLDLVFTVEEQPTTDIQAGMTFSGSTDPDAWPLSLMVKWTDRNFLGRGNTFGISGNISNTIQDISIEYTQKWLFGLPLSGGFDLTLRHAKNEAYIDNQPPFFTGDGRDGEYPDGFDSWDDFKSESYNAEDQYLFEYELWSISVGFSTGYRWRTPFGNFGLGGGFRVGFKSNDYDRSEIRAFNKTLRENDQWTPATSIYFSASLDDRDIYYDPTKGYYLVQRVGFYGLLPANVEEEYFLKTDSRAEIFFTIWNWQATESWAFKGVLGFHTGFSFLFPEPGRELQIDPADELYIDGMFTARGWRDQSKYSGYALWENWAELRIPIVPGIIALDFLFDAAEVADKPSKLFSVDNNGALSDRMRFSTGGGLRFAIPQFPFRFLFVKRFTIRDGEVYWEPGAIGGGDSKHGGVDFVLTFAISTY